MTEVSESAVRGSAELSEHLEKARMVLARCDELAAISSSGDKLCRVYLSSEHAKANALVGRWMHEVGMRVWQDATGNICGRYAAADPDAPVLLLGSHLDTIPDAGRFDGMLGVLLGIAAVAALHESGERLPYHLDVVGFGEEEGVRFGATLLCSRAVAGNWNDSWMELRDEAGGTLRDALRNFGLNSADVALASRAAEDLLGYLELHIEQGPVLEAQGVPLGVVTSIAGTRRLRISVSGAAGHAGTVPMNLRRDALVGAALGVAMVESLALSHGVTATVGQIQCEPGAANVIPGEAEFTVDIRSGDDARRDAAMEQFLTDFSALCDARGLSVSSSETHRADAASCAPWLQDILADALSALGLEAPRLESGAGHDAMALAAACDVGMLFVRCKDGISHHPDESVSLEDVGWGLAALKRALGGVAKAVGMVSSRT